MGAPWVTFVRENFIMGNCEPEKSGECFHFWIRIWINSSRAILSTSSFVAPTVLASRSVSTASSSWRWLLGNDFRTFTSLQLNNVMPYSIDSGCSMNYRLLGLRDDLDSLIPMMHACESACVLCQQCSCLSIRWRRWAKWPKARNWCKQTRADVSRNLLWFNVNTFIALSLTHTHRSHRAICSPISRTVTNCIA